MAGKTFPFKGAVFDLDGTLLDTLADIANSANEVLNDLGLPTHPVESYRYFVGDGVRVLLSRVLPEDWRTPERIESCLEKMRPSYLKHLNVTARPYPEIPGLLAGLKESGCQIAVLSNKPHNLTELCVSQFFDETGFDPVFGLQDGQKPKPDPAGARKIIDQWQISSEDIVYFGDTSTDMETALRAGMHPVGVQWGFRQPDELTSAGARIVIESAAAFFKYSSQLSE